MLSVWGRRSSFNVQKVMWLIGELGLKHQHIPAGGGHGIKDTQEFRAMNPHGKVPVINDNGVVVWESHSILRYLAASYGRPSFWNDDAAARSSAIVGWTGLKRVCSQLSLPECSGAFSELHRSRGTQSASNKVSTCARNISCFWIKLFLRGRF